MVNRHDVDTVRDAASVLKQFGRGEISEALIEVAAKLQTDLWCSTRDGY